MLLPALQELLGAGERQNMQVKKQKGPFRTTVGVRQNDRGVQGTGTAELGGHQGIAVTSDLRLE